MLEKASKNLDSEKCFEQSQFFSALETSSVIGLSYGFIFILK